MKLKEIKRFGDICIKTQKELKRYLYSVLSSNGYKPVCEDGFIYAKGELPYLVTAHMDTVHKKQCDRYSVHMHKGKHRIQSKDGIGGDDRCGIYMIVRMVLDGYRPSILFCEDEEIGSIGAGKFCKTDYINNLGVHYMIELDRANSRDAVFYDCDNKEFTDYILTNSGYEEAIGSWSDICELSEASGIASVNFSCGYYKAHTPQEYVIFEEMQNTLKMVEELLRLECEDFEYIPAVHYATRLYKSGDEWYEEYFRCLYGDKKKEITGMEIVYNNYKAVNNTYYPEEDVEWVGGTSERECFGEFFMLHPNTCFSDVLDWYEY